MESFIRISGIEFAEISWKKLFLNCHDFETGSSRSCEQMRILLYVIL